MPLCSLGEPLPPSHTSQLSAKTLPSSCQVASAEFAGSVDDTNAVAPLHSTGLPVSFQLHGRLRRWEDRYDTGVGSEEF